LSLLLLGRARVNDLFDTVDRRTVVFLDGSSSFAEILTEVGITTFTDLLL
jgi:hypothetical protein